MRTRIAALLFLCMLFSAVSWAQEEGIGFMKVVNCQEWVSLREEPDAASECLVEVPLGAIVENCSVKTKVFTYAEYQGLSGFIMSQYLEAVPMDQNDLGDMCVSDQGAWIPMRLGAGDEETIIQWLAPNTCIEACVEPVEGYAYGLCNGLKGYVRLADLHAVQENAQP